MTTTITVYPALDQNGASRTVYAEDGVTVIPAVGAIVPYVKYYIDLLIQSMLLTSDPLSLSGDPITVAPATRVSGAVVGLTVSALGSLLALSADRDVVVCTGLNDPGDGGGGTFFSIPAGSMTAYGGMVIDAPNCQWVRAAGQRLSIRWFGGIPEIWTNGEATGPSGVDCGAALTAARSWALRDVTVNADAVVEVHFPGSLYPYEFGAGVAVDGGCIIPEPGNHRQLRLVGDGWDSSAPYTYGQAGWLSDSPCGLGTCLRAAPNRHLVLMENDGTVGNGYRRIGLQDLAIIGSGNGIGVCQRPTVAGDHGCGRLDLRNVFFGGLKVGLQICNAERSTYHGITAYGCDKGVAFGYFNGGYTVGAACWGQLLYDVNLQYCNSLVWWRAAVSTHIVGGIMQGAVGRVFEFDVNNNPAQNCSVSGVHSEVYPAIFACQATNVTCQIKFDCCRFGDPGTDAGRTLYGAGWVFEDCIGIEGFEWRGGSNAYVNWARSGRPTAVNAPGGGAFTGQWYISDPQADNPVTLTTGGAWAPDLRTHGRNITLTTNADLTIGNPTGYATGDEIDLEILLGGDHIVRFDVTYFNPTASLNDDSWSLSGARGVLRLRRRGTKWQVVEWSGWGAVVELSTGIVAGANAQGSVNLAARINAVATVASANDAVTMPAASPGARCVVINNGANSMNLYPASGDNLGAGVNTAVAVPAGSNVDYIAYDRTNWEAMP